jgi:diguanylate cyclase (GGDEF)-like protein
VHNAPDESDPLETLSKDRVTEHAASTSSAHDAPSAHMRHELTPRSSLTQIVPIAAQSPRFRSFAVTDLAIVAAGGALATRFFTPYEWVCAVLWLAPLPFLFAQHQRGKWSLYGAVLWFGLAWLDLVHPAQSEHHVQLRGVLSLSVLGGILLRLRQVYRGMQELSRRDPLTGLLNRRGFEELGSLELQRAGRYRRPIAFALLDVDRFKQINDRFGHATGDRVLRIVAEQLCLLRKSDLSVRLGGDEFGLLMPETDVAGAELLIARLRQLVDEHMAELGWTVTLSVGITEVPARLASARPPRVDGMIAEADARMYEAKTGGYAHAQ